MGGATGENSQLEAFGETRLSWSAELSFPLVLGNAGEGGGTSSGPLPGEERWGDEGPLAGARIALPPGDPGWFWAASGGSHRGPNTGCVGTGWNRGWL